MNCDFFHVLLACESTFLKLVCASLLRLIQESFATTKGEEFTIPPSGMCVEKIELCGGKDRDTKVCENIFPSPKL